MIVACALFLDMEMVSKFIFAIVPISMLLFVTKSILEKHPAFIFVLVFMKSLLKVPCMGKVTSSNVKMNFAVV